MLDKNLGRRLSVNKGKARAFLGFCVELANAEPEHYEGVFTAALNRGDFKTDFYKESAFSWFEKHIPNLVDNVRTLAACVSGEEYFYIEAHRSAGISVASGSIVMGIGSAGYVEYYKESSTTEEREIIKRIGRNELIDAFFETLPSALYQPTEGATKMIPIRQCPECKRPFLARRWDQAFCSLQHSQKWRSREKYRKTQEK